LSGTFAFLFFVFSLCERKNEKQIGMTTGTVAARPGSHDRARRDRARRSDCRRHRYQIAIWRRHDYFLTQVPRREAPRAPVGLNRPLPRQRTSFFGLFLRPAVLW